MNTLTDAMSVGLRWKARSLPKDRQGQPLPLRKAVWINRPLAQVQGLLKELLAKHAWQHSLESDKNGRMTKLEVVEVAPDLEAKLPPELMLTMELRRIKAIAEAGEAPTVEGQTHGERGLIGRSAEELFLSIGSLDS